MTTTDPTTEDVLSQAARISAQLDRTSKTLDELQALQRHNEIVGYLNRLEAKLDGLVRR
jgi:hypothetical protein